MATPEQIKIFDLQREHRKTVANEKFMRALEREAGQLKTDFMSDKIDKDAFIEQAQRLVDIAAQIGYALHPSTEPHGMFFNVHAYKK